jgi:hypothetical protein
MVKYIKSNTESDKVRSAIAKLNQALVSAIGAESDLSKLALFANRFPQSSLESVVNTLAETRDNLAALYEVSDIEVLNLK